MRLLTCFLLYGTKMLKAILLVLALYMDILDLKKQTFYEHIEMTSS